MAFFNSAVGVLQTLVIALGAGLGIWGAINLLEGDTDLAARVAQVPGGLAVLETVEQIGARVAATLGEDVDTLIADRRYAFISGVVEAAADTVGRVDLATAPLVSWEPSCSPIVS